MSNARVDITAPAAGRAAMIVYLWVTTEEVTEFEARFLTKQQ